MIWRALGVGGQAHFLGGETEAEAQRLVLVLVGSDCAAWAGLGLVLLVPSPTPSWADLSCRSSCHFLASCRPLPEPRLTPPQSGGDAAASPGGLNERVRGASLAQCLLTACAPQAGAARTFVIPESPASHKTLHRSLILSPWGLGIGKREMGRQEYNILVRFEIQHLGSSYL